MIGGQLLGFDAATLAKVSTPPERTSTPRVALPKRSESRAITPTSRAERALIDTDARMRTNRPSAASRCST